MCTAYHSVQSLNLVSSHASQVIRNHANKVSNSQSQQSKSSFSGIGFEQVVVGMGAFEGLKPQGREIVAIIALTVFADVICFAAAQSSVAVQQEYLIPHNNARREVGVDELVWSRELENYARSYAQDQRDSCLPLTHSTGIYGENLFWGSGKIWTPSEAVTAWNDEKVDYNYNMNKCAPGKICGHYTQVVWNTTTHVGCASEMCSDDGIYIICSYDPPGNWVGEKPY